MPQTPPAVPFKPSEFDPATAPRRLNLGCGWDYREGFVNVDLHAVHKPDLLSDVRALGFLPAQHYDEIVAQDVLEHMPRTQTLGILEHWNRLLRKGGVLRLRVPNVVALLELLKRREYRDPAKQEEVIHFLFGTQAYTGDFHFTSFTDVLLEHYLGKAGFALRRLVPIGGWLYDADAEKLRHVEGPEIADASTARAEEEDAEFIRGCYREVLQREADDEGFRLHLTALRAGSLSRQGVIDSLRGSAEYRERARKA